MTTTSPPSGEGWPGMEIYYITLIDWFITLHIMPVTGLSNLPLKIFTNSYLQVINDWLLTSYKLPYPTNPQPLPPNPHT